VNTCQPSIRKSVCARYRATRLIAPVDGIDQRLAIKVETFVQPIRPCNGKIETVSLDAIQDEKRGLIYAARVKLGKATMNIEGKEVKLVPGMSVTVEIKTGQRRLIEYFLSPLIQYASEGLRER